MKKVLFTLMVGLMTIPATAQTDGPLPGTVLTTDTTGGHATRYTETGTYWQRIDPETGDTIRMPIFKGPKGGYFVVRTSKTTGEKYRQYLTQCEAGTTKQNPANQ